MQIAHINLCFAQFGIPAKAMVICTQLMPLLTMLPSSPNTVVVNEEVVASTLKENVSFLLLSPNPIRPLKGLAIPPRCL